MRPAVPFVLALLSFLAAVPVARATSILRMDVEDLARAAQVVAVARVDSVESRWEPDGSVIVTETRLTLERSIAGEPPNGIVLTSLGGSVGGITALYAGGARLRPGERVVVFLEPRRRAAAQWLLTGAYQGAFRLEREAETGMDVAVRETARDGVSLVGPASDAGTGMLRMYLDELEARVRAARGER